MSRVTLLVAEDDDDMRAYLVRALSGDGYRVLEARNGGVFRRNSRRSRPDPSRVDHETSRFATFKRR